MTGNIATLLLLDGATGTELQKRGMPVGVCTEEWVLRHPEELLDLQRAYVDAGAMVLTAPTFGANPASLRRFGLEEKTAEYNGRLVSLTRKAAGGKALVAGDLAPCGMRSASLPELTENYAVQTRALRDAGVDLYVVETMLSLEEARAAVLAVRAADRGKPVLVSFYPAGSVDLSTALAAMRELGAAAFGLNCAPPEVIAASLRTLSGAAGMPLLAMPGFEGKISDDALSRWAAVFAGLGVEIFGGCCGTGPAQIASLAEVI